jgi:hypothetical protein
MIKKFTTVNSTPAIPTVEIPGSSTSTGSGNNTLKTVLIVGLLALAGYGLYRYFKKKNETVVYVEETDDY